MRHRKNLFFLLLVLSIHTQAKTIKVLAIGNSFSEDAVEQYLYELAAAQGDSLIIGNAYIPGCSIDRHYDNIKSGKKEYAYRKIVGGERTEERGVELSRIILDEPWDVITLQQASKSSGVAESYTNLPLLKRAVKLLATNPQVEFLWHMTWSYANSYKDERFETYGNDQKKMYADILNAVRNEVPKAIITRIIPSGTAIQLVRYRLGDILNRDGLHLSYTLGRYVVACTWCEVLTGRIVDGNPYWPETLTMEDAKLCQMEAHEAVFMQQLHQYVLF